MLLANPSAAGEPADGPDLRRCIEAARDAGAVAACELTAQGALKERITRWSAAIEQRLPPRERALFTRSQAAWEAFLANETALLDATLAARRDGLAAHLRPGAVTRLLEQRETQLREHLHNLSYGRGPGPAGR
jgi:uncharacterized protein YecT (DUF1311 family)